MDRNRLGAAAGLGLGVQLLRSAKPSLVCEGSSLDWVLSAAWTKMASPWYPHPDTGAEPSHAHLEPAATSYRSSELLSREKEPFLSGTRERWQPSMDSKLSKWLQKFGEAAKKF